MFLHGAQKTIFLAVLLGLLTVVATCPSSAEEKTAYFQTTPDQVLVLYNADWSADAEGSDKGQDSLELAEYYQAMHTDPVTGKQPFLLPLTCVHGDDHLNDWFIKEESTDNRNAIIFAGSGKQPEDYNWVLDSRNVEITVPEKNTDWDSVTIRVRSESNGEIKTVYARSQTLEGANVKVSGVPQRQPGYSLTV